MRLNVRTRILRFSAYALATFTEYSVERPWRNVKKYSGVLFLFCFVLFFILFCLAIAIMKNVFSMVSHQLDEKSPSDHADTWK